MIFSLVEMLGRRAPVIDIIDVGAMLLDEAPPDYKPLLQRNAARVVGFEPVPAECAKLNAQAGKGQTYLPYFIGDGTQRTFHLCNFPMTSSLYEPNTRLLRKFNNLAELTTVVETSSVKTTRLDDIAEISACDYLKLDIQGAELDALRGGMSVLEKALVVELEVEFVPMYLNQPLFADVDPIVRGAGFMFHTFKGTFGRAFKPLMINNDINRPLKQMLAGDAIYVRDFTRFGELSAESLLKIAVILHEVYSSLDLAALALQHYDAKTKAGLYSVYMHRLHQGGKPPAPPPLD